MKNYIYTILNIILYISSIFLILLGVISLFDGSSKIFAIFNVVFAILFLPYIFKLFRGKLVKVPSKKFKIIYILIAVIGYGVSFGFLIGEEATVNTREVKKTVGNNTIVFDINSLYGKNIDEIKDILGQPSNDTEPADLQTNITSEEQLAKEWDKTWAKNGYELTIFYETKSRKVIDLFISTNDTSGATTNTELLEEIIGGESLVNFIIEKVPAKNKPGYFTGIKIVPIK